MRTIILTKGLPASGKSTWAVEQQRKYPGKYKRVNRDLLRLMLDNNEFSQTNENFINEIRERIVEKALLKGFDVIIDDTNFLDKNWESMCRVARRVGDVRIFEKYFEISIKEAKKRNASRGAAVPESVIDRMFNKYINGKHIDIRDDYFQQPDQLSPYNIDPTTKDDAIIVDLDGTLAINTGRDYYDYSRVIEDEVNERVYALFHYSREKIIIVSGRDDVCMDKTKQWLNNNDIHYDEVFMRKTGDTRKDWIVKQEIYDKHIKDKYHVLYAIDDRPQVCRMWRSLGMFVLQVNDLEF